MSLAALPDSIKSRILSHLLQPKAPTYGEQQQQSPGSRACIEPRLRGRSIKHGPLVLDGWVTPDAVKGLLAEARRLVEGQAAAARMGGAAADAKWTDTKFRGDTTVFLHPDRLAAGGCSGLAALCSSLAARLQPWLASQGYDVGGRPTFQLGHYPGGGARYVRHRDASLTCTYRTVTALLYLNEGWRAEDGGELCIYHLDTSPQPACCQPSATGAEPSLPPADSDPAAAAVAPADMAAVRSGLQEGHAAIVVPPVGGRLVLFDSSTEHEVLPSYAARYAVAVWFTRAEREGQAQAGRQQGGSERGVAGSGGSGSGSGSDSSSSSSREGQGQQEAAPAQQVAEAAAAAAPAPVPAASLLPAQDALHTAGDTQLACSPSQDAAVAGLAPPLQQGGITRPGHIFVSVASYRDSETQWTLLDLFEKAEQPELVRVGVVWQVDWAADAPFVRIAPGGEAWVPQVRQVVLHAGQATGPCKARALAQQLWDGEEFYLQVDSHMRFVQGWDTQLLCMLRQAEQQAGHSRVVLSTYPPGYQGEGSKAVLPAGQATTVLCASHFGPDGMLRLRGRTLRSAPHAPLPALFWAAGFSFSRAQLLQEAPYDSSLAFLFFGEEMYQLVRMWRRGWDMYTPCAPVAYHLWSRAHRPTFQADSGLVGSGSASGSSCERAKEEGAGGVGKAGARCGDAAGACPPAGTAAAAAAAQRQRSQQRVLWELGRPDAAVLQESSAGEGAGAAGVPTAAADALPAAPLRSLAAFYEHCGVDFARGLVGERALQGGLAEEQLSGALLDLLAGLGQLS